jgi:outer membrane protein assembly factor BamB
MTARAATAAGLCALLAGAACGGGAPAAVAGAPVVVAARGPIERVDARVRARVHTGARAVCAIVPAAGHLWIASTDRAHVIKVDPSHDRVVARVALPAAPCALAVHDGLVWARVERAGLVVAIDPRTDRVVRRVRVEEARHCRGGLAAGAGALWVAEALAGVGAASKRDPATGATLRALPRMGSRDRGPCSITIAGGAAWIGTDGPLYRVDVRTGRIVDRIDAGFQPRESAATLDGDVWVGNQGFGEMRRIDARSGRVIAVFRFGGGSMVARGDEVWATASLAPTDPEGREPVLARVDAGTNRLLARYRVGRSSPPVTGTAIPVLSGLAVADGALWVGHNVERRLYRVALTP